jgi:hypothetical protein
VVAVSLDTAIFSMPETLFLLGKNLVRAQLLGDFVF